MGNKAGVILGMNKASDSYVDAGRDVAMQVAAMKPLAVNKDGVDSSIVEKEIEIGKEQARAEGKPEAMLDNIAKGKIKRFFKDNTLVNQAFIKDSKMSVADYVKTYGDITVVDFKRVALG